MTALLTDNLPLLAGAPNGIKKLRELILELAVRGKLVPQDPNNEPANELLKRIAEEKARLVAEGKIKKQKPLAGIEDEEKPFELPSGWVWRRFGEVFSLEYGDNLPADKRSNTGEYPVYGSNGVVGTHSTCFVDSPCIVVGRKGSAGALNLCLSTGCCVTDVAYYCIPPSAFSLDYAFKLFHTLGLDSLGKGIKPGLNRNEAYELVVAVPPLAEQHRIVAKVDELMALCDRLEARQADAGSAHTQLVQALLDSLTLATDAADFAASWQRLAEHFHTLFTTESSIDALKQTLLQLAVMGKLVPQDPCDEPASELLRAIAAEKDRLVKAKRFKAIKKADAIEQGITDFQLPAAWEWARLADVAFQITDGAHHTPVYVERGIPFLSVKDMSSGCLDFGATRFISEDAHEQLVKRCRPELGDLLLTKIGTTGVPVVVDTDQPFSIFVSVALIKAPWSLLSVNYIRLLMDSPLVKKQSLEGTEGVGNKNLVLGKIANFLIAIPPLAEQHRIVAKVDQLMVLCDQLKARLNQARQVHEQLASALVEQAVN
ncbi:restriction endonuclease subunit S [Metapseudomonas otitidis]|uniref:restriction endonuclease subunit S n=1 Tax=Metapseudomonas otitidis TaxID=319939 RepID=UPI0013F5BB62|nr:restriction endonuclease subunit S [Pseudomonas otitidis]